MTDFATTPACANPAAQPGPTAEITITQLEAAINYWRARLPSHGEDMKLCQQAGALSKPYALMIVQRHKTLALSELEPNALEAYKSYESLMKGSG